jgi:hypothetical protein
VGTPICGQTGETTGGALAIRLAFLALSIKNGGNFDPADNARFLNVLIPNFLLF